VELSEIPGNLIKIIGDLTRTITGNPFDFETESGASSALSEALGTRRVLLVIDDVWREEHLRPFLLGGANTTRLITTRIDGVVPNEALRQGVDAMTEGEAAQLIAYGLPTEQTGVQAPKLKALTERVGEWALLIKLVNGFLRQRVTKSHEPLARAIESVNKRLDVKGLVAFDAQNAEDRSKAVARTINASLELLCDRKRIASAA
jgi:hypothetical protein